MTNTNQSEKNLAVVYVPVDQLINPDYNPRKWSEQNTEELKTRGMRQKLEDEIARFNIFQRSVLGTVAKSNKDHVTDIRNYAKYILKEGVVTEKRELLANLRSKIVYKDKMLTLVE